MLLFYAIINVLLRGDNKINTFRKDFIMDSCLICNSENLSKDVKLVDLRGSDIGLKVKSLVLPDCEFLYASVCKECGNVQLYVKDPSRAWA